MNHLPHDSNPTSLFTLACPSLYRLLRSGPLSSVSSWRRRLGRRKCGRPGVDGFGCTCRPDDPCTSDRPLFSMVHTVRCGESARDAAAVRRERDEAREAASRSASEVQQLVAQKAQVGGVLSGRGGGSTPRLGESPMVRLIHSPHPHHTSPHSGPGSGLPLAGRAPGAQCNAGGGTAALGCHDTGRGEVQTHLDAMIQVGGRYSSAWMP